MKIGRAHDEREPAGGRCGRDADRRDEHDRGDKPRRSPAWGGRLMNLFVADPHWGWWIILYFYLGGIAAGAYFTATLIGSS